MRLYVLLLLKTGIETAPLSPMILAFFVFSSLLLGGAALVAREITNAPIGEETERGFEVAWCNNTPDTQDVSCVWVVCGATA